MPYLDRIVTAFSRFLNAAIGGDHNETLSGRSYRQRGDRVWLVTMHIINALFFLQTDPSHCERIYKLERKAASPTS